MQSFRQIHRNSVFIWVMCVFCTANAFLVIQTSMRYIFKINHRENLKEAIFNNTAEQQQKKNLRHLFC